MTKSRLPRDIFEECLDLLMKGETIEGCLNRYPDHSGELRPLLETAAATLKAVAVQPPVEARSRVRQGLLAAMSEKAARQRPVRFRWDMAPRWAMVAAAFVVLLATGSGVVLASAGSMPDQPLYAVKQVAEQTRLALTLSPAGKAGFYATLADRRVTEIVYLAQKGKPQQLAEVTRELDLHLARITDLARTDSSLAAKNAAPPEAALPEPASAPPLLGRSETSVTSSALPPSAAAGAIQPASTVVAGVDTLRGTEKNTGASVEAFSQYWNAGDGSLARTQLRDRVASKATNNSVLLRAALNRASPEARQALLRAIAVSETGYEKILQALFE